jgi:isopentenyl-diphosphate delta-isomerase
MSDELFDTFDASGNPTGTARRSRVHREGLWHRAANVFLFRSDGRLIVQQRHRGKDVCPGIWDLSAAEHLKPGETYEQGALRGLREELGVENIVLERIGDVVQARLDVAAQGIKDYELQQAFRGTFDDKVRLDLAEVCAVDALPLSELAAAFVTKPSDFTPWFRHTAVRLGFCRDMD